MSAVTGSAGVTDLVWPAHPAAADRSEDRRVVVIGGGLAGIAAALVAADSGAQVVLVEARPRLGGATTSFQRSFAFGSGAGQGGGRLWIDTGQHVFMRCCTAYRGLLARLGVSHLTTLQPRLDVEVLMADSRTRTRLRRTRAPLPPPLHLAPALLGYRALPPLDRIRAALAALRIGRLDQRAPEVDGASFGSWLDDHGQSPVATEALWELLTVATLNAPAEHASLGLAAKVVRTGLLEKADAGDLGWPDVPLQRLHGDAALRALAAAGAEIMMNRKVRSITRVGASWQVMLGASTGGRRAGTSGADGTDGTDGTDGGILCADGVVLAVPPPAAAALLPDGAEIDASRLRELGASPIVNIHMIFDRPVLDRPFLAVVGSPIQWIFDRTESSGLAELGPTGAQYLALSQSAAGEWIDQPAAELGAMFVDEMHRLFPAAAAAELLQVFVTRERTATFDQAPGSLALRPGPAIGLPGFALAGAWTDTGWPATMEGAVRSGIAAARETLASMGGVGNGGPRAQAVPAGGSPAALLEAHVPKSSPRRSWGSSQSAPSGSSTAQVTAPSGRASSAAGVRNQARATQQTPPGQPWPTSTGGFPV